MFSPEMTQNSLWSGMFPFLLVILMDKKTLVKMLHQNENDYHELPMYGLIADWYLRYWHLHIAVYQYLELDKEDYYGPWPLRQ